MKVGHFLYPLILFGCAGLAGFFQAQQQMLNVLIGYLFGFLGPLFILYILFVELQEADEKVLMEGIRFEIVLQELFSECNVSEVPH